MKNNFTENTVLMQKARESLAGKWGLAVGAAAVYLFISIAVSSPRSIGWLISLLISGPLAIGLATFSLSISRNKAAAIEQLFVGFKNFGRSFVAYLIVAVCTLLWMILLIVPGIIAALSYSQTFFILADDKTISANDAVRKSKKMMYGHKWRLFCLGLRFLGWILLSVLTMGIGFLWVLPYMQISMAKFYDEVKTSSEPSAE